MRICKFGMRKMALALWVVSTFTTPGLSFCDEFDPPAYGEVSDIVPITDQLNELQSEKLYIEILSREPKNRFIIKDLLEELHQQYPEDLQIKWNREKVLWAIANEPETEERGLLVPKEARIDDRTTKLTVAEVYGRYPEMYQKALKLYKELLHQTPKEAQILIDMSRIYLEEKKFTLALTLFKQIDNVPKELKIQLMMAQLEAMLGYSLKSRDRFERLLVEHPNSEKVLRDYAWNLMSWGGFYEAEVIYQDLLERHPNELELTLKSIDLLIGSQRFLDAEGAIYDAMEQFSAHLEKFLLRLVRIKREEYNFDAALCFVDQLLEMEPNNSDYLEIKADLLFKVDQFQETLHLCRTIIGRKKKAFSAYILAGRAAKALGDEAAANSFWTSALDSSEQHIAALYYLADAQVEDPQFIEKVISETHTAQALHAWADLYAIDGFCASVIALEKAGAELDPSYMPAKRHLAEMAMVKRQYATARAIYQELLCEMPWNQVYLIGFARANAWGKKYVAGIEAYQVMIEMNPYDPVPRLEQARTAYWGKFYDLSMNYYQALRDLDTGSCWSIERRGFLLDLEMAAREQEWLHRNLILNDLEERLVAEEPGNPIWEFEYGQSLCSLDQCQQAESWYSQIVHDVPMHSLARLALAREMEKELYSADLSYFYWQEKGYGDLSQVGRYEGVLALDIPFACNQHLRLAEHHWVEHTFYDNGYHAADGQSIEWHSRVNSRLQFNAGIVRKQYTHEFNTTYNCFGEIWVDFENSTQWGFGFKKKDEIYNYFNLEQNTQGKIWWSSLKTYFSHSLSGIAYYENVSYSDRNALEHATVTVDYQLTEHPKVLKASLLAEYRNTDHTNIYIYNPQGNLVNIIHPYWAPQNYFLGQALLEWRHDYGDLEFCGAPEQFYDIKLSAGTDTQDNPYCALKAEWVHELFHDWKFSVLASIHHSPQWSGKGVWCTIRRKF